MTCPIIILWAFFGVLPAGTVGGWAQFESFEHLSECKVYAERINRQSQMGKNNIVTTICLPVGMDPK